MITLRLFRKDEPARQIDSYIMGDGDVTIGRDPKAVWVIDDPDLLLSRFHCTISAERGGVFVRDTSANGVFAGAEQARIERDVETALTAGDTLQIGDYLLKVDIEEEEPEEAACTASGMQIRGAPMHDDVCLASSSAIREGWSQPQPAAREPVGPTHDISDVVLLEAFCEGAQLDPSYLSCEDPAEVMRRMGEIYRQLVLGLGDLMSERASAKAQYRLERTTIGSSDNNPLKWAPTHRLAIDLLCNQKGGFLNGSDAVKECFEDLKEHILCLLAGSRAAVSSVLEHLDPDAIEAEGKPKTAIFVERSEVCWRRLKGLHAEISENPFNDADSAVSKAFKYGYESRTGRLKTEEAAE
ncbi:MAG: type VI secretion system-associated FHA domain protein TagH [Henriciella sp.]|uniref:type VI secretion system-associated FHA domain protein TagH n=1 Tax=Henriciella sp. TaxID=1968823 RepID=UPI003C769612